MLSTDGSHSPIDELLEQIPLTRGRARVVEEVVGGLTNQSFRVRVEGKDLLVRVFAPNMELFGVDRETECVNTSAAARSGVAPGVLYADVELGVLVSEFVAGRMLSPDDLVEKATQARVIETLRRLHSGADFQGSFEVRQFRLDYLKRVRELRLCLPNDYESHLARVEDLERLLTSTPEPLVPCHNDLAAENMIDDGERVWLVDFEFAAMNEASFDLANLALSSRLSSDAVDHLTAAYWASDVALEPRGAFAREPRRTLARVHAWIALASFAWVPWAAIQNHASRRDFDFVAWVQPRYDGAVSLLRSPTFEQLVDDLTPGRR